MVMGTKDDDGFPPLSEKEIKDLKKFERVIAESGHLDPKIRKVPAKLPSQKKTSNAIESVLSEHMDSFILHSGYKALGDSI